MGRITMVSLYLGMNFPNVTNSNYGFPFTTMTVPLPPISCASVSAAISPPFLLSEAI